MSDRVKAIPLVIAMGGRGSRIGGDKPLQVLAGRTLLDRAVAFGRTQARRIALAGSLELELAGFDAIPRLDDDVPGQGPIGALLSAMAFARQLGADRVAVIGCDLPFLPDDLLERLGDALGHADAALASSGGRLHPIAGLWRTRSLSDLEAYAGSGRRSLIGFAESIGFAEVSWPAEPIDPFFNVNTADDLVAADGWLRTRSR
jgi:molybdenum cofactor guanylyltransferase